MNVYKHVSHTDSRHSIDNLDQDVTICKNSTDRLIMSTYKKKALNDGIDFIHVLKGLKNPGNVL